jgi:hypothetical protein
MMKNKETKTAFFLHLPKTGGSSIRTLINENYASEELLSLYGAQSDIFNTCMTTTQNQRQQLKLVQGHMPYGVHDYLGLEGHRYLFFLREPVARTLSDIEHSKRHPSHGFHHIMSAPELSLQQRIEKAQDIIYYRNNMTHFLSGTFFTRDVTISDFHLALERVRHSEFVGITEQSELSLLLMARRLGWRHVIPYKCNVSPSKTLNLVEQYQQQCQSLVNYDQQLYQVAQERFECDVAAHGPLLQEAAEQMRTILAQQETDYPDFKYRSYMVGESPAIPLDSYRQQIAEHSPLGRWLAA